MRTPQNFIATYECERCGEEMEMQNFYAPYFSCNCEGCGEYARYVAQQVEHKSWEWDVVIFDED